MTGIHAPRSAAWESRVRDSFAAQAMMANMGASLGEVAPGRVIIEMPFAPGFTQQHGFLHGGAVASVLDSACGYAGFSLMDDESAVLTAEFKINFLAPAAGDLFRFEGQVIKPGRTLVPTEGRAFATKAGAETLIATMSCTLMAVRGRGLSG
ncbi:PaaI family thioesterase [Mesobacterium pallidum]|uniref:PaaI family thioesterase n=1 Tax=Mesobacterium pallidum TaxID=2872037 RepID=UPI001EE35FB1|nr:PaaI family thioesterase [Mesobacterium pallidum]